MYFQKKAFIVYIIIFFLLVHGSYSYAQQNKKNNFKQYATEQINHNIILDEGIDSVIKNKTINQVNQKIIVELTDWYDSHPQIEFARLIETTITVKFIDGSYTLLLDIFSFFKTTLYTNNIVFSSDDSNLPITVKHTGSKTALILNPSEYLYGNYHCRKIINKLICNGYNIAYLVNEDVDLSFIENNLASEIIYINTHAGYWDIDGDSQSDAVVIGTGEFWTNDTKELYNFEYENKMIVEGRVGDDSFIAFTPLLIDYFYGSNHFPDSLVYMATCHATYDDSMANAFLNSGTNAYIGWQKNTIFWTNSLTSIIAFNLLIRGFSVKQVCRLIRYGGVINCLLQSKLTYYGDGKFRLLK
jgi:hypothetical protein